MVRNTVTETRRFFCFISINTCWKLFSITNLVMGNIALATVKIHWTRTAFPLFSEFNSDSIQHSLGDFPLNLYMCTSGYVMQL